MLVASFASPQVLRDIIQQQKRGQAAGIYSICSIQRQVIEAALRFALEHDDILLIETTCNQVNPWGGYSGLTPKDFVQYCSRLAEQAHFPVSRLLLGGDHLGPYPWRKEPAAPAMAKSAEMVRAYVANGYRKIHLDTSMSCADDPLGELDRNVAAQRTVALCRVAEAEADRTPETARPVYVIGSEVPTPGGRSEALPEQPVTQAQEVAETLAIFEAEFRRANLESAWERVIALVVQPGVEFGDDSLQVYDRGRAAGLVQLIRQAPNMVYEAHSTDYQNTQTLRQMVEDQFAILKVGPALTFALREAVFALECIEQELLGRRKTPPLSHLRQTLLDVMRQQPQHWRDYYHGSQAEIEFKLVYSYSDRIRYYWNHPRVVRAYELLIENLRRNPPPPALISQYLPRQWRGIHEAGKSRDPEAWIWEAIQEVIQTYHAACHPQQG